MEYIAKLVHDDQTATSSPRAEEKITALIDSVQLVSDPHLDRVENWAEGGEGGCVSLGG